MSGPDRLPVSAASDDSDVDTRLFEAWIHGRARARGMPPPTPHGGGYRVETGLPHETRRFVFRTLSPELVAVAEAVREPRVFVKAFVIHSELASALLPDWEIQPPGYLMIREGAASGDAAPLPHGFSVSIGLEGSTSVALVRTLEGAVAARGRAADWHGYRIYDQIVTEPGYRRRGLGRALMAALEPDRTEVPLLVATEAGRALYMALGWRIVSPYTSAVLPG